VINRRIRREARRELEPIGVTPAQLRALRALDGTGRALRMSELADRLGIARRSATDVVGGLVDRRLVAREADPDDGRAVVVGLTDEGRELLRSLADTRRDVAERLFGALDPGDRALLATLLARVAAHQPE